MQKLLMNICVLMLFTSCVSQNNTKIDDACAEHHTFRADYDKVWDATLNHLSSHYTIDSIDINAGTIHAHFSTTLPKSLLDCGKIKDSGILPDGTPFSYIYDGAESPVYTISKINNNYMHKTRTLKLEGNIQINLQSKSKKFTIVSIKTHYTLNMQNTYRPIYDREKSLPNTYNENNSKETISFYNNDVGEFSTNASTDTLQCRANTRMTDSIIKNITQLLRKE